MLVALLEQTTRETMCCRLVVAVENETYSWLGDLYSQTKYKSFNYTKWGVGNVSMLDVLLQHRHLKEDMIASYVHVTTVTCVNSGSNIN